jgi:disulfide bond formation protein DsbB
MYSLVFVLPTGILLRDSRLGYYSAVLSFFGAGVALYHNLIYYGFIREGFTLCTADLSCKTRQFELFGVLSIPTMSFLAFALILVLSLGSMRK